MITHREYLTAGNSIFTLESGKTGRRFMKYVNYAETITKTVTLITLSDCL